MYFLVRKGRSRSHRGGWRMGSGAVLAAWVLCGSNGSSATELRYAGLQASEARLQQAAESESTDLSSKLEKPLALDDCIQIALERNVPLIIARYGLASARTEIGIAYGEFLPVFSVSGSRLQERSILSDVGQKIQSDAGATVVQKLPFGTIVEAGYTYSKAETDALASVGPSLVVTQPLLRDAGWRTATSGVRDAEIAADLGEMELRAAILDVQLLVKTAYYDVLHRKRLIEVNRQAVARDEQLLAFSKAKVEAQLATRRDVLSAEIILAQDHGQLVDADARYRAALDELSNILGLRIDRPIRILDETVELRPVVIDEDAWLARAMRDNPSIQDARLRVDRNDLSQRIAGNGRLPQLDLTLAYDETRSNVASSTTGLQLPRDRTRTWQGSLQLTLPLFNKPLGNAYRRARIEYEQSRRALLDTQRAVTVRVRDSARNLRRIEERITILERQIDGARAKVEFATVNFQLGRASNLDITDAQKDLVGAETDYIEELVNYRIETSRLERLVGGSI